MKRFGARRPSSARWIPSLLLLLALPAQAQESAPPERSSPNKSGQDAVPVPDRWRIPLPDPDFYPLYERGSLLDPYRQNVLKGDSPIVGQNLFLALTGRSDTTVETRQLPVPRGVGAVRSSSAEFFGAGEQFFVNQDLAASVEIFRGETSFRPRDWEARVTGVLNYTYLDVSENAVVGPDAGKGTTRSDRHAALQEALADVHLLDVSDNYDFVSLRAGIQPFVSDFRGLVFSDTNLGVRLYGTLGSNRVQWNVAAFDQLEKDTNSELNTLHSRDQEVWIANLYVQDFICLGYTAQVSVHASRDDGSIEFDDNGFLVRPALMGTVRKHEVNATYFGWTGDGHIERVNLSHALYVVHGRDGRNPLAGRETDVMAFLAAMELSCDIDWVRLRGSFLWASGDRDPTDSEATGFDSILEAPYFAGGTFSFWNRQALKLQGVNLVNRNSHLPDLRSSKTQGQLNFVNPGLFLMNAGVDVEVMPEVKAIFNASVLRFHHTQALEAFTSRPEIAEELGYDFSLGLVARPLLNNHIIVTIGASAFVPAEGFEDLYGSRDQPYSLFAQFTLIY